MISSKHLRCSNLQAGVPFRLSLYVQAYNQVLMPVYASSTCLAAVIRLYEFSIVVK